MAVRVKGPIAAAFALAVLATPLTATSSTFVLGNGFANMCSRLALAGQSDTQTLMICNKAIEEELLSSSDRAKTYVNRGVIHMRRQNLASADRDFDQASLEMPKLPEVYINRAVILIKKGQYDNALKEADKGIALQPDEPEKAYFNRALAREAAGDVKGAYADYTKALELKPDWAPALKELSRFTVQKKG